MRLVDYIVFIGASLYLVVYGIRLMTRWVKFTKNMLFHKVLIAIGCVWFPLVKYIIPYWKYGFDSSDIMMFAALSGFLIWRLFAAGDFVIVNVLPHTVANTVEKVLQKHQITYERPEDAIYILQGETNSKIRIRVGMESASLHLKNLPIAKAVFKEDFIALIEPRRYEAFPLSGLLSFIAGIAVLFKVCSLLFS